MTLEKSIFTLLSSQNNPSQLVEICICSPIPLVSFLNIQNQNGIEVKTPSLSLSLTEDYLNEKLKLTENIASWFEKYNKEHRTQFQFRVVFDQK